MQLARRTILTAVVAVLVVGTGVATVTGSLGGVPVVGPLVNQCGPGDGGTEIAAVNEGEVTGETVTIEGKLDRSLQVDDVGITAFNLDGQTGTIPVSLDQHPNEDLDFGDCLRVRGVVNSGESFEKGDGPAVVNATVVNR